MPETTTFPRPPWPTSLSLYKTNSSQLLNFNPAIAFDGTNDHFANLTPLMASTSGYTYFVVAADEDAGTGYRSMIAP